MSVGGGVVQVCVCVALVHVHVCEVQSVCHVACESVYV